VTSKVFCGAACLHDTQCGFKLFTDVAANTIFPLQQISGFGFDVELLFISQIKGFKIEEISVNWTDIPITKVKLFRDSWRMFTDVLKMRLNYLRGFYGCI
jgi:dolichyl-phosphate beta-glucosyltransferase